MLARPPSVWYLLRKFARRNRVAAAISVPSILLLVAIAVGSGLIAQQAQETANERAAKEAEQQKRITALQQEQQAKAREAQAVREQADISRYQRLALAYFRWKDQDVGEADRVLDAIPRAKRGWTWHFLKRLCHPELTLFQVPGFVTQQSRFSGDGRRLLLLQNDHKVSIWDAELGRRIRTLSIGAGRLHRCHERVRPIRRRQPGQERREGLRRRFRPGTRAPEAAGIQFEACLLH